jgi:hypothetical protein
MYKRLVSRDAVKGRLLYHDSVVFTPTHKLVVCTNHRPRVIGTDDGIWRRLRLIEFGQKFVDAEDAQQGDRVKDKNLLDTLQAELPGILAWAVQGAMAWYRDGLGTAEAVRKATTSYRQNQDIVARFISACCVVKPTAIVGATALYTEFKNWCERSGEPTISQRRFGENLGRHGFNRCDTRKGIVWEGVGLAADPDGTPSPPTGTGGTPESPTVGASVDLCGPLQADFSKVPHAGAYGETLGNSTSKVHKVHAATSCGATCACGTPIHWSETRCLRCVHEQASALTGGVL